MGHNLVQPICIQRNTGTHSEVVEAVAFASVQAWLDYPDLPTWDEWLSGRFTKTVRRGSASQMGWADEWCRSKVTVGDVTAYGFEPMHCEALPKPLSKMQVSGLDRQVAPAPPWNHSAGPIVCLNHNAGMSTGKMAAQAAHGLFAWVLRLSDEERQEWIGEGQPASFLPSTDDAFFSNPKNRDLWIVIDDAGFTEIEPGTTTAVVIW